MPKQTQEKIVNYSKEQMFNLVSDIDNYYEFLPWCKKSTIISKKTIDCDTDEIIADLDIGYMSLSYSYRSRVILSNKSEFIKVTLVKGPFKHLINEWKFFELEKNICKINFYIDFEMNIKFFNHLITEFFQIAFNKMVKSFEDRAKNIYSN